jgi:hypothetical protein
LVFLLWPGYYNKSDETTTEIILRIYTQEAQNVKKYRSHSQMVIVGEHIRIYMDNICPLGVGEEE